MGNISNMQIMNDDIILSSIELSDKMKIKESKDM